MGHLRARVVWIALLLGVSVLVLRGQSPDERHVILENLGLSAVDEGLLINDETHAPTAFLAHRRAAVRTAVEAQATSSAARFVPGRLIVKFKDQSTPAAREAAVAAVSSTARIDAQPTYADFNIVRLDPAEDVEAAAAALGDSADVEYAQPSYTGWHTMLVPNDP